MKQNKKILVLVALAERLSTESILYCTEKYNPENKNIDIYEFLKEVPALFEGKKIKITIEEIGFGE